MIIYELFICLTYLMLQQLTTLIKKLFPNEQLLMLFHEPWFIDICELSWSKKIPSYWPKQDKYRFLSHIKHFYWGNHSYSEAAWTNHEIMRAWYWDSKHSTFSTRSGLWWPLWSKKENKMVLQFRFYWLSLFKDIVNFRKTYQYTNNCEDHKMKHDAIAAYIWIEMFDIWRIYVIGPLPNSFGN